MEFQKFPFVQKRLYDFSTKRNSYRFNWNDSSTRILMVDHDSKVWWMFTDDIRVNLRDFQRLNRCELPPPSLSFSSFLHFLSLSLCRIVLKKKPEFMSLANRFWRNCSHPLIFPTNNSFEINACSWYISSVTFSSRRILSPSQPQKAPAPVRRSGPMMISAPSPALVHPLPLCRSKISW